MMQRWKSEGNSRSAQTALWEETERERLCSYVPPHTLPVQHAKDGTFELNQEYDY